MGLFGRRAAEKTRQRLGVGHTKDFEPTHRTKLNATYKDLKRFANELRDYDSRIAKHLDHVKEFNHKTMRFLDLTKPRMHTEADDAEHHKSKPLTEPHTVGEGVRMEEIASSAADSDNRIYHDVREPIQRWIYSFESVSKGMSEHEKLRLLLDSRRNEQSKLNKDVANLENKRAADDKHLHEQRDKMHKQQVKLDQVEAEYSAKEEAIYADMQKLVDDADPVLNHVREFFKHLSSVNKMVVKAIPGSSAQAGMVPAQPIAGAHHAGAVPAH